MKEQQCRELPLHDHYQGGVGTESSTVTLLTFWQPLQLFRPEAKHQREKVTQMDSSALRSRQTAVGAATAVGKHKSEV